MHVDVDKLKNIENYAEKIDITGNICPSKYGYDQLKILMPVRLIGKIENNHKIISIEGQVYVEISAVCDRCGQDFSLSMALDFAESYSNRAEAIVQDEEDRLHPFEGNIIDLAGEILHQIYLEMPMKLLCRDDCKGLCAGCGANLNNEICTCSGDEIDPRLEKLKLLLTDLSEKGV